MAKLINNVIHQSLVHAGYTINANGGGFHNGVPRPLEDKVRVAEAYARLLESNPSWIALLTTMLQSVIKNVIILVTK